MANTIVFAILAVVILGSAVMCVMTKRIMRAATFLLFVLFGIAGIYFLLDYTFLGAAQISVYAGGVTMIYIFAIQLVNKQTLRGFVERMKGSRVAFGAFVTLIGFLTVALVFFKNHLINRFAEVAVVSDDQCSYIISEMMTGAYGFAYIDAGIEISSYVYEALSE